MFRELTAPINVQWEVTPWCNLRCVHCYNYWRRDGDRKTKLTQEIRKIYGAVVSEIIANKVFSVTVTGGEPLGVFDFLLPFLKQLAKAGVQLLLNSNVMFLTKDLAIVLKDELGIKFVLVSLPAGDPSINDEITQRKGAHAKTTKGIRIALENGIRPAVNMVVTKRNLAEVFTTAEYVKSLGVTSFAATRASVPGNCSDFSPFGLSLGEFRHMLNELIRVKKELGLRIDSLEFYPPCSFGDEITRSIFGSRMCTAGKTSCTIGFDGQLRPCSHAPQTYGDIREGLREAWLAMHPWRTHEWLPEECKNCAQKNRCVGGFKIEAFLTTGSLNKPDPYCDFSQLPINQRKKVSAEPLSLTSNAFAFNPILRFREEVFGGVLYVSSRQWVLANKELYKLATGKKGGRITTKEVAGVLGVSIGEASKTTSFLLSKSILQNIGGAKCPLE